MPPMIKYKREDIINIAYNIVKNEGFESLNVRRIAKELNSSIQPVFHNFNSMEELKKIIYDKILETYRSYMEKDVETNDRPYRQIGINYIEFAKKESKLFEILFMSSTKLTSTSFASYDPTFNMIQKYASMSTNLNSEQVQKYHLKMWIFTHGIASLVASKTCSFTDDEIKKLLMDEYKALLSLKDGGC